MKHKNPYIAVCIVWAILTGILAVASVVLFVEKRFAVGALLLILACSMAFTTGRLFEKASQIVELNRQQKWLASFAKEMHEWAKEVAQDEGQKDGKEPFAEFDKAGEVPFEEMRKRGK